MNMMAGSNSHGPPAIKKRFSRDRVKRTGPLNRIRQPVMGDGVCNKQNLFHGQFSTVGLKFIANSRKRLANKVAGNRSAFPL
jgi:hypothetical protein